MNSPVNEFVANFVGMETILEGVVASYVTRESFAKLDLSEGKEVYASFKATSVHLISRRRH